MFKTIGLYSSGGVVGIAMGAYAGETQFESRPVQEYFSYSAELCQNIKTVCNTRPKVSLSAINHKKFRNLSQCLCNTP